MGNSVKNGKRNSKEKFTCNIGDIREGDFKNSKKNNHHNSSAG